MYQDICTGVGREKHRLNYIHWGIYIPGDVHRWRGTHTSGYVQETHYTRLCIHGWVHKVKPRRTHAHWMHGVGYCIRIHLREGTHEWYLPLPLFCCTSNSPFFFFFLFSQGRLPHGPLYKS